MLKIIARVAAQLFTGYAVWLTYLAHQYMTDGYGLTPMIALPSATLLVIAHYMVLHYADR